jgi:WD40 repeat protein
LLWDLGGEDEEVGMPIEFADADAFWFNPNTVLNGPELAVSAFVTDGVPGSLSAVAVLDDTGKVVHELLADAVQLHDGRFVAIPISPEEGDLRWGPLVIWDPEMDVITELTHCSALESALDHESHFECPGDEPMFGDPATNPDVVVSVDGTTFASAAYTTANSPRPVWVWETESLEVHSRIEVSDDEELLAVGSTWLATWERTAESVIIRDSESGEVITELRPVSLASMRVELSPDGSMLFKTDTDGGVWVFDTLTWELVAIWDPHNSPVRGLAFSPDGQQLVTTSNDDFVKLWDISGLRDRSDVFGAPPLLDRIPAPSPSDAVWLGVDHLAVFLAEGAKWLEVSLSVEDLVADARARLTRSFTVGECATYQIDPCPTFEEIKGD